MLRIATTRYPSTPAAHNAMVAVAEAGQGYFSNPVSATVEGISYQTTFYPPDGPTDWAFAFHVAATLVVVEGIQVKDSYDTHAVGVAVATAIN